MCRRFLEAPVGIDLLDRVGGDIIGFGVAHPRRDRPERPFAAIAGRQVRSTNR